MTVRHLTPDELAVFDKAVADSLGATASAPTSLLPDHEAALRRAHVTRPDDSLAGGYAPHPNAEALAAKVYAIQSEGRRPTREEAREIERLLYTPEELAKRDADDAKMRALICPNCDGPLTRTRDPRQAGLKQSDDLAFFMYRCQRPDPNGAGGRCFMLDAQEADDAPAAPEKTLHLITQRNQPYGSVRWCCEECGAYGVLGTNGHEWTDNPDRFANPPETHMRCTDRLRAMMKAD